MNDQSLSIASWFPFNLLILLPLMGVFNEEGIIVLETLYYNDRLLK